MARKCIVNALHLRTAPYQSGKEHQSTLVLTWLRGVQTPGTSPLPTCVGFLFSPGYVTSSHLCRLSSRSCGLLSHLSGLPSYVHAYQPHWLG